MIMLMTEVKTDGNQVWADDYGELLKRLDHLDLLVHEIHEAIVPHKAALTRAAAMLDRGKVVREYLRGGRHV